MSNDEKMMKHEIQMTKNDAKGFRHSDLDIPSFDSPALRSGPLDIRHSSFSRRDIAPGITLDARRCVFLSETKTLVIADLHFGYAWAQRHGGNLLPLSVQENAAARITALIDDYAAREVVLLGDVVHRAVLVDALKAGLIEFVRALSERAVLKMILGN